tara:strand:- start:457 stop:702 length:246 start_codon:yes stop_codon:yes gene_type:complete
MKKMIIEISKGQQISLPSKIRNKLKLKAGNRLEITENKGKIILTPIGKDLETLFKEAKKTKPKHNFNTKQMEKILEDEIYR